jgi:hypothetical protein
MKTTKLKKVIREALSDEKEWSSEQIREYEKVLNKALVGKELKAFGPSGNGLWGQNEKVLTFKVEKVTVPKGYITNTYGTINIYLSDYDNNDFGSIYTDEIFMQSLRATLGLRSEIDYSEQGMQGQHYVNCDTSPKKVMAKLTNK